MAKTRSRLLDLAGAFAARVAKCVFGAMPPERAAEIADALAWIAYRLDRRHRQVALDNVRQAFPGRYTDAEAKKLVLETYRHFAKLLLELVLIPRAYQSQNWRDAAAARSTLAAGPAYATGRPILILTAHFGNWEIAAFFLRAFGVRAHLVARPLDNPFMEADLKRFREATGHTVLSKNGDLSKMCRVLEKGGSICTLADQDAGPRGLFVDFFGRPASTHKVIAFLAQRTNALIVVVGAMRVGGLLEYDIRSTDVIDPADYANHPDSIRAITQRMNNAVEELVRLDPSQYLWLHRRWKSQPPVETKTARAA